MPYTLNGIGTRYYGRKNVSVTQGVCGACGRAAQLSDYDTREFFCLIFVPVIPLQRYRIQRDCARCRRHLRLPLKEFQAALDTELKPLRDAAERSPRDAAAQAALVQGLIGFRLMGEAEETARRALSALPSDGSLNALAGALAAERGDDAASLPFLRAAAAAAPGDAQARLALGEGLATLNQWPEAIRELDEARRIDPSSARALELLGDAHRSLKQWSEALQAYQLLADRHPELAGNAILLRKSKECKEALGYPVSPEEKKAGRRWWPLRGRTGARQKPGSPVTGWKAVGVLAGGVAALVLGAAGWGLWQQHHVAIYFDNGLKDAVTMRLDAESFPLKPGPPLRKTVAPGSHAVAVSGSKGSIETLRLGVEKQDLFDALFEPRFYVYNVAEAHIYRRERIGYAPKENDRTYDATLVAFQRVIAQGKIDYLFEPAPETISMKESSRVDHKTAFNVASNLDYALFGVLKYREGNAAESEKAFRKAIALEPCHVRGRKNLVALLDATERTDAAVNEARTWIERCPESAVEAHRAYQDVRRGRGEGEALLAEYRARLAAAPDSAVNHYLVARVAGDPAQEVAECDAALRLDPALTWARVARAYALLALERCGDAKAELTLALQAPDCDPSAAVTYAFAAIGDGSTNGAGKALEALGRRSPHTPSLATARWLLALGAQQWAAADKMAADELKDDPKSTEGWERRVQFYRLAGRTEDLARFLERSKNRKDLAGELALLHFERAFEEGRYRDATAALASGFSATEGGAPALYEVYAAAGLLMAGDRNGALELLPPANAGAARAGPDLLAGVLRGDVTAEEALRRARSDNFLALKHAYFMLGARARARGDAVAAKSWFEKSERASLDLEFPLLAARALASGGRR